MPERLIDANALMKKICGHECGCNPEDCDGMESETVVCNFHAYVSEQPTIEPEVRHGRWIPLENGKYRCSSCGHKTDLGFAPSEMIDPRDYPAYLDKYCGKCGARMDGGAENG